ncbi:tRNA (guanine(37)-N(1))-methyltransferase [hydrothermal vent metagenome]|uniref:tRNA (guanine-N(1)-)-methyltransferase n=1 Tax=hydrothermal vent metagenome TaxID=652676 RepID=A0A3B0W3E3_9ZZZZ
MTPEITFDILTLFPEFFDSPLRQSVIGRAVEAAVIGVTRRNIRDYSTDKHRSVDSAPYGGGAGMVMRVEPVVAAIEAARAEAEELGRRATVILLTPQGGQFSHEKAVGLAELEYLVLVCGRYEGFDERVRGYADMELSIGDYVLAGGEAAALVVIDAVGRLIPGVLGDIESVKHESFSDGALEYPQYTRPEEFRGAAVPPVLLSGNHALIDKWRAEQSVRRTAERRPGLLEVRSGGFDGQKAGKPAK